jgi:ketosteroid isomerase-like protein
MRRYVCVLGAVVLAATGCGRSVDVEEERRALLAADRQFAQSTKDVDLFMSYWMPDATAHLSGSPAARGVDAIRTSFAERVAAPGVSLSWAPERAEVSAAGDLGYTIGAYEMTAGGATDRGKYLTVWKKQPEGTWKVIEDIANSSVSPAPGADVPARQP